jgi:hypothetical protein
VITAWREHKAAIAAEKKAQRSLVAARFNQVSVCPGSDLPAGGSAAGRPAAAPPPRRTRH